MAIGGFFGSKTVQKLSDEDIDEDEKCNNGNKAMDSR